MEWESLSSNANLLEAAADVGGLWLAAIALLWNARELRIENDLKVTEAHRELWLEPVRNPRLTRILSRTVNLTASPVTVEEREFLTVVFAHANTTFRIKEKRAYEKLEGADSDVRDFFRYPIPAAVWRERRAFLDKDFVEYVDRLSSPNTTNQPGQ